MSHIITTRNDDIIMLTFQTSFIIVLIALFQTALSHHFRQSNNHQIDKAHIRRKYYIHYVETTNGKNCRKWYNE